MVFATLWRLFNVSVSSMATTDTLSMITLASALIESFEVNCAVASLLLYDYVLCIGEEVRIAERNVILHARALFYKGRVSLGCSVVALQDSLSCCKGLVRISLVSTEPRIRSDI